MKTLAALAALALVPTLPMAAQAAGKVESPTRQLAAYVERVIRVLEDPAFQREDKRLEGRRAVRDAALEIIDAREAARRALGVHWRARTRDERERFTAVFVDLLERNYSSKIDLYGGERVTFLSEQIDGEYAIVRAKVIRRTGIEVPAEARLIRRGGRWLVYDIVVENLSLIANYRAQFDRIIRTASYTELLRRLEDGRAAAAK